METRSLAPADAFCWNVGMRVVVASANPVKIDAVRRGFAAMFPGESCDAEGIAVPSGVADQPMSDAETLRGARTRAANARELAPGAAYWVGLEGGVEDTPDGMLERAWMCVLSADGAEGIGSTGTFVLPERIAAMIRAGKELGHACDEVFATENLKHGAGAVGKLTDDAISRTTFYEDAVILALIPFKRASLYAA